MFKFDDLRDQLSDYLTYEQVEEVSQAYLVAAKAHEGQKRSSGEDYITHPIEVARILANMHMDHQSIMAALLHDVIEDSSIDKEQIAHQFGNKVADLVDGVSKLEQISSASRAEVQAENLRKMMLAMAKDMRVILIKLADRLHNMRTLEVLSRERQRRIALETIEIYAPIANRLGMNSFRLEFEDLGFLHLYPARYQMLKDAVNKARGNRKEIMQGIEQNIKARLDAENLLPKSIRGREKHLYSLYKKMQSKELTLPEIMDVYALRIVVEDVDSCYRILGVIHNLYKPVHGRFKDYIAVPKSNGYQSLHTTVLGPHGVPVEIQIRTEDMDNMASNGICAHWLYKEHSQDSGETEKRAREWLKGLLEIQKTTGSSIEFIEHVKVDLYPDEVYVFTPSGDILSMPSGATCVDFAYMVHTDIGNSCIAAKLDRRLAPLSSRLASGQTIEIITANGAHPNPSWLSFVVTAKARSSIRHWLKMQKVHASQGLGCRLIERALAALDLSLDKIDKNHIQAVVKELNLTSLEHLFAEVGLGNHMAPLVARRLVANKAVATEEDAFTPLAINGTEGMVVSYAKCCRPIPGDSILGFLSAGRGIVIHRENCKNVGAVRRYPEKYIFVEWSNNVAGTFPVELRMDVLNRRGVLATLANALADCNAQVENVYVDERDGRHHALVFLCYINNKEHLEQIIRRLSSLHVVTCVARTK